MLMGFYLFVIVVIFDTAYFEMYIEFFCK